MNYLSLAKEKGFTLIELMIAMVLGLLIIIGVSQVWTQSYFANRTSADLSSVQDSTRAILNLIRRDFMLAGHSGCYGVELTQDGQPEPPINSQEDDHHANSNFRDQMVIKRDGLRTVDIAGTTRHAYEINYANNTNLINAGPLNLTSEDDSEITLSNTSTILDQPYLLTNCQHASMLIPTAESLGITTTFKAKGNFPYWVEDIVGTGNESFASKLIPRRGLQLLEVNQVRYEWRDTGEDYEDGSPIGAIFRGPDANNMSEILRGVAAFNVQLSILPPNGTDRVYVESMDDAREYFGDNPPQIQGVRINIALRPAEHQREALTLRNCFGVSAVSCTSSVVMTRNLL